MGSSLEAPMYSLQVSMKHDIVFLALLLLFLSRSELVAAQQNTPDPYTYSRLSPSMAVIVVVLIAALFFMGFFSVYIRHCSGTGADAGPRPFAALSRRSAAARGLEPSVIETFPTFVYSVVKGLKLGKGALECAVCLNEFEDDETLRLIPKCDHVFHPECIDAWLSSHTTCPVCRSNLAAQPGDSPPGQEQPAESQDRPESDIESQHDAVESEAQDATATANVDSAPEPQVIAVDEILKRNRTRGSRSGRARLKLPRSHSTGHSLVQPGEDTERFTLRLPVEVRKQLMNRKLNRSTSLVVLPRESSSRRGYRNGIDGGSSRGKSTGYRRLERPDGPKLDRWASFIRTPSFFLRASSLKSPRVASNIDSQSNSARPVGPESSTSDSLLPPV